MNKNEEQEIKKEFQLERVILFSDAVFAIIITIMVLDIRLPENIKHADPNHLRIAFLELIPKALAYGLSFVLVAKFWLAHLKMFSHLKDYDAKLLIHNLVYLFSVSLFPFAVTLISGNIGLQSAIYGWGIYTYAGIILISTLSQTMLSHYLITNRERLCFEPEKVTDVLKYKALKFNFITIPVVVLLVAGISVLGYPTYYSVFPLGIYGFAMGQLYKKYYPKKENRPFIVGLYHTIKQRRLKKRTAVKLSTKKKE